jgi:hypothetical protein
MICTIHTAFASRQGRLSPKVTTKLHLCKPAPMAQLRTPTAFHSLRPVHLCTATSTSLHTTLHNSTPQHTAC